jgi:hypothetical protein
MFTKHHSNGEGNEHLDNHRLEQSIFRFQAGDAKALTEIVGLTQNRTLALIRFHKTSNFRTENELLSDINYKLMRSIGKFDPSKGSAFTFVSAVITSTLKTSVTNTRRDWVRYSELSDELVNTLRAKVDDDSAMNDLRDQIRAGAKTTLVDPLEIKAQQWFLESFVSDGFDARRHECADACMAVFTGITHAKSREIHDMSRLELRRLLYDDLKRRQPIEVGRLLGTRCAWMALYRPLLSADEFTKFVVLMRNLAPYLLLIIDPANRSHRRDRSPTVGRKNLQWILDGHPSAVPLFPGESVLPEMTPIS